MALLYAGSMNGPYAADHPFIDFDPLGLTLYPAIARGGINGQDAFLHNWGFFDEGVPSSKATAWHGIRRYQHPAASSVMNTIRPEYPVQIRDANCDWGLQGTLIGGLSISDESQLLNPAGACEMPLLVFRDKAQGDQIGVWLLVDTDPNTPVFNNASIRWRLEVRRGATVLFTSANILPYRFGSAESGLNDLPAGFEGRRYMQDLVKHHGWLFVEFKAVIHPTTGSYELRVDGQVLNADAGPLNTAEQGTAGGDQLKWSIGGNTAGLKIGLWVDDVYLCDNTTAENNNFLGRIQVHEKAVSGQGNASQWTPDSGAASHDTYVSYISDVNDAAWLESNTPGDDELFTYSNMPRNMEETLLALRIVLRGALSVGGDRDISPTFRTGGTTYVEPSIFKVTGPSFISIPFNLVQNPATLAPWTKSAINGQELGFRLIA